MGPVEFELVEVIVSERRLRKLRAGGSLCADIPNLQFSFLGERYFQQFLLLHEKTLN